jgi:hypothetical protein
MGARNGHSLEVWLACKLSDESDDYEGMTSSCNPDLPCAQMLLFHFHIG